MFKIHLQAKQSTSTMMLLSPARNASVPALTAPVHPARVAGTLHLQEQDSVGAAILNACIWPGLIWRAILNMHRA